VTALLEQLRELAVGNDWDGVLVLKNEILATIGPAAERAEAIHTLGRAHWHRAHAPGIEHDPWDLKLAVQYARQALSLASGDPDLQGRIQKALGTRLVTIGRFSEGRKLLVAWLSDHLGDTYQRRAEACYSIGYSYRYEGELRGAENWYWRAYGDFANAGNTEWMHLTKCAIGQVLARQGRVTEALDLVTAIPDDSQRPYLLKALTEIMAAHGDTHTAITIGEMASEALLELDDQDPWELAELHLLLADLQFRAGNRTEQLKHLALAQDVLRTSPRHDLYRLACMLLDNDDRKEESA
jgi:tetratricopeptide (TPR) repeat protein